MRTVEVIEKVGEGGQGTVWKGRFSDTGEMIAIKRFTSPEGEADGKRERLRFLREIRCQRGLNHVNVMNVLGDNSQDAEPWYIMPWGDETLRSRLVRSPDGFPRDEVLEIFNQILDAIDYAHSEKVLHRDLKPENVVFVKGIPRVSDFGLSRRLDSGSLTLTLTNIGLGTHAYSAPEQFQVAHQVTEQADIYSLGKILFELLTGKLPFPFVDLDLVEPEFRYIIRKAIQNDASKRYESVRLMKQEIALLTEQPSSFQTPIAKAKAHLENLLGGDGSEVAKLHRLLLENNDDLILYTEFVPLLPSHVIETCLSSEKQNFFEVLRNFDQFAEGNHPWSFTDVIADFLERVYFESKDEEITHIVLNRLLVLGAEHNRFHVGRVFHHVATDALNKREGGVILLRILQQNEQYIPFVKDDLLDASLPQRIRDYLELGF